MPKTLRGIYHNLKESNYTVSNSETVFFFSSKVYMNKFLDGYQQHRENFTHKMSKITIENPLNMSALADINYYNMIEKRGFRALLKGVDISWEELHNYSLRKMTEKETLEWRQIPRPKLVERLRVM